MLLLEYLYQALNEPYGVSIACDPDRRVQVRAALYKTRKDACDPQLDGLSVVFAPGDAGKLWIVKNGKTQDISE